MTSRAWTGLSENQTGIFLMVLGMAGFAIEDLALKLLAQRLPVGQVLLTLGVAGAFVFGFAATRRGERVLSPALLHPAVLGRNASEMVGTFGFVLAIALSPLTTATAIFQATPLFVTMGAALFLGERVGWRRWTAIAVGFGGVMVVVRPGGEGFDPASLWAVLAVVGLGARDLFTRRIPGGIESLMLVTWGFASVALVGALQLLVTGGAVPPNGIEAGGFALALVAGGLGYWALTESLRVGEVSAVTPFRYVRLVFALLLGTLVLGERPDAWTLAGAALIVASGLYSLLRERARARAAALAGLSPAAGPG